MLNYKLRPNDYEFIKKMCITNGIINNGILVIDIGKYRIASRH